MHLKCCKHSSKIHNPLSKDCNMKLPCLLKSMQYWHCIAFNSLQMKGNASSFRFTLKSSWCTVIDLSKIQARSVDIWWPWCWQWRQGGKGHCVACTDSDWPSKYLIAALSDGWICWIVTIDPYCFWYSSEFCDFARFHIYLGQKQCYIRQYSSKTWWLTHRKYDLRAPHHAQGND